MQLLSGPFHTGFKGPELTGRPLGGYLVSRPVTKFNGQPSLPVLLVTENYGLQNAVAKIAGYIEIKWAF